MQIFRDQNALGGVDKYPKTTPSNRRSQARCCTKGRPLSNVVLPRESVARRGGRRNEGYRNIGAEELGQSCFRPRWEI